MYTVSLWSATGQQLYGKIINHAGGSASETINYVGEFSNGCYNLQITGNGKSFSKRIVK